MTKLTPLLPQEGEAYVDGNSGSTYVYRSDRWEVESINIPATNSVTITVPSPQEKRMKDLEDSLAAAWELINELATIIDARDD